LFYDIVKSLTMDEIRPQNVFIGRSSPHLTSRFCKDGLCPVYKPNIVSKPTYDQLSHVLSGCRYRLISDHHYRAIWVVLQMSGPGHELGGG